MIVVSADLAHEQMYAWGDKDFRLMYQSLGCDSNQWRAPSLHCNETKTCDRKVFNKRAMGTPVTELQARELANRAFGGKNG